MPLLPGKLGDKSLVFYGDWIFKRWPLGPGRNVPGLLVHLSVSLWEIAPGNPSQRQPGLIQWGKSDGSGVIQLIPNFSNMISSELPPHTALCCRYDLYITLGQAIKSSGPLFHFISRRSMRVGLYLLCSSQNPQWSTYSRHSTYSCWRSEEQISDQTGTNHQL